MTDPNISKSYDAYVDKLHDQHYKEPAFCSSCEEEIEEDEPCSNCGYFYEPDWEAIIENRLEYKTEIWLHDNGH